MKDYLGNNIQVNDRVIFIWFNCTFQEGRVECLYDKHGCIGVGSGGNLYTIYPNQCIKIRMEDLQ